VISGLGLSGSNTDAVWGLSLEIQPYWTKIPTGGINLGARYFHSAVYEPNSNMVLAFNGINPSDGTYRQDARRLDCAGGWWLQAVTTNGMVQVVPNKSCFQPSEHATLIASPSGGATFDHWSGDASGSANPLDLTMDADKTVFATIVTRTTDVEDLPLSFAVTVHPNPSVGPARIQYSLPREALVRLSVFDVAGREVARLVEGRSSAGRHVASWNASGPRMPAGVYLVRFETPEGVWTRRLALLR